MINSVTTRILLTLIVVSLGLQAADKPNILWITSEDNSPYIGAYGDELAKTPNIDGLAKDGILFRHAFSTAAVCAPARTTLLTGMYPPSLGAEHMRSQAPLPDFVKGYPYYLKKAGYYTTNNSKTDYNVDHAISHWDESSNKAHWKNRPDGKPFFAIFNTNITHESNLHPSRRTHPLGADPSKVRVPAYLVDNETSRNRLATYYHCISLMDTFVGERLQELEDAGLAEDTIVFYYSDHGGVMPRSKRFIYNSGTQVPMIVRFPKKWAHLSPFKPGTETDEVVGFIDLAATLVSLTGDKVPEHMQGRPFLGKQRTEPLEYGHTFRARADERIDFKRGVTDGRFNYIRNYLAYLPTGQHVNYLWDNPAAGDVEALFRAGKATPAQSAWFLPAPLEELFDLENDPDEVNNLANDPKYRKVLLKMRKANRDHMLRIRDTGFIPEALLVEWSRESGKTPWDIGHDEVQYPLEDIMDTADALLDRGKQALPKLMRDLRSSNPVIQYWALINCMVLGDDAKTATKRITPLTRSPIDATRIAAAEHLARLGEKDPRPILNEVLINNSNVLARLQAINALDHIQDKYPYDPNVFKKSAAIWPTNTKDLTADWMGRYKAYDLRVMEFLEPEAVKE